MTLKDQMAIDASNVLFNSSELGESIVYTAKRPDYIEAVAAPGSGDKAIYAYVQREDPNPGKAQSDAPSSSRKKYLINRIIFQISKDATLGIATVSQGFDTVKISIIVGETASAMRVTKIVEEYPGMWILEAEK